MQSSACARWFDKPTGWVDQDEPLMITPGMLKPFALSVFNARFVMAFDHSGTPVFGVEHARARRSEVADCKRCSDERVEGCAPRRATLRGCRISQAFATLTRCHRAMDALLV
jgi:hypothetical protein